MKLQEVVDLILREARKDKAVRQAEGYASRNTLTMTRIETLRWAGTTRGPAGQQLSTMTNAGASVRIVVGKAMANVSTNYLTPVAIAEMVETATSLAKSLPEDPDFVSLPGPMRRSAPRLPADRSIAGGDTAGRLSDQAEAAVAEIDRPDLDLAGSIMAVSEEVSLANTEGIDVHRTIDTFAVAQLTAERLDGSEVVSSGLGWSSGRQLKQLDGAAAARDALELARITPQRTSVPEGEYRAILGPYAVADILYNQFCGSTTLGRVYYGMSWLPTKLKDKGGRKVPYPEEGRRVAAPSVTIVDDPTLPDALGSKAIDDEGIPTKRTPILEKGILRGMLSNSYYANLYGESPTGHGFRFGMRPGRLASTEPSPTATNTVMKTGDWTLEEMVEDSSVPTLYIPRTWYTYPLRYGGTGYGSSNRSTAFIVEKKQLVSVAPNAFKLIGDISRNLKEVRGIGKQAKVATTWAAANACIVPHVLTGGFRVERPGEGGGGGGAR